MNEYKKYTSYKDTGIEWLPVIPLHWEMKKINDLFVQRSEKCSALEYMPLSVTKFGIVPQLENAAKSKDNENRKLVIAGDFVINSRSDRRGSSGFSKYDGSVSLINIVLTPRKNTSLYYHYLLRSHKFIEEFYRNGKEQVEVKLEYKCNEYAITRKNRSSWEDEKFDLLVKDILPRVENYIKILDGAVINDEKAILLNKLMKVQNNPELSEFIANSTQEQRDKLFAKLYATESWLDKEIKSTNE